MSQYVFHGKKWLGIYIFREFYINNVLLVKGLFHGWLIPFANIMPIGRGY